jgi:hypothetical protein
MDKHILIDLKYMNNHPESIHNIISKYPHLLTVLGKAATAKPTTTTTTTTTETTTTTTTETTRLSQEEQPNSIIEEPHDHNLQLTAEKDSGEVD